MIGAGQKDCGLWGRESKKDRKLAGTAHAQVVDWVRFCYIHVIVLENVSNLRSVFENLFFSVRFKSFNALVIVFPEGGGGGL